MWLKVAMEQMNCVVQLKGCVVKNTSILIFIFSAFHTGQKTLPHLWSAMNINYLLLDVSRNYSKTEHRDFCTMDEVMRNDDCHLNFILLYINNVIFLLKHWTDFKNNEIIFQIVFPIRLFDVSVKLITNEMANYTISIFCAVLMNLPYWFGANIKKSYRKDYFMHSSTFWCLFNCL